MSVSSSSWVRELLYGTWVAEAVFVVARLDPAALVADGAARRAMATC
jgi:hypothetical protein